MDVVTLAAAWAVLAVIGIAFTAGLAVCVVSPLPA